MTAPRKFISARVGDQLTKFSVDSVLRFRADDKFVMADLVDGRSMYMPRHSTIKALGAEFIDSFITCNPALMLPRLLLVHYTQGTREEGGGWLRVAGSGEKVRVTDAFRNEVAEAVVQRRIEIALAGPSDAKVTPEDAYAAGKQAREGDWSNSPPRGLDRVLRGWWMAGWNDTDIERGKQHE